MPMLLDEILTEYADRAFEAARLGPSGAHTTRDLVSAQLLARLEAGGDAMRFVDNNGQIRWKATPDLRQYLKDLELDAQADLRDV
jgi:hypothetical protein